jgi:5-methylthioribose kinase
VTAPVFTADDLAVYAATRDELRAWGPVREVTEVGDGNINNVFRVRCANGSFVVKQSMPYVRVDATWALSVDRIHCEAEAYRQWALFARDAVPELYLHDRERCLICVEDLVGHAVWRSELDAGRPHPDSVQVIGRLLAGIAFYTSSLRLVEDAPSPLRACVAIPDMAALMDNLAFCEPYVEHARNTFPPAAAADIARIRSDGQVLEQVGRMRRKYVTTAEALIHGDLHTGSVMVTPTSCKVIDCEFSAYGPVAWDIGQLAGNLLTAAAREQALRRDPTAIVGMLPALWTSFSGELRRLWADRRDPQMTEAFLEQWLAELEHDAMRFGVCEIFRRLIGNLTDFAALDERVQAIATCGLLRAGRTLILGAGALDWKQAGPIVLDAVGEVQNSTPEVTA